MQTFSSHSVMYFSRRFILLLCCLAFFFTSCADVPGTTTFSGNASGSGTATTSPAKPKSDMNGIDTEELLRAHLTKVDQMIQGMSLDEKLGQLLMVEFFGSDYQNTELPYMVSQQYVGGFLYQPVNHNFDAPNDTVSAASQFPVMANADAKIPLLVAIDQEGGQVSKLTDAGFDGSTPSAATMTATGDTNAVEQQGKQAAKLMQSLGINTDLAPVVDVGPVTNLLENRQFSDDPKTVATYASAFLNGLQSSGTIGCLKHFPGLGSLSRAVDPHTGLPVVNESMSQLESADFVPYKTMIQQDHPAMIMSTDVITTAIDPQLPAELSPKAINGVLRKELGYNGVVITDGLYMGGIQQQWTIAQASVLAIIAGNDIVEGPYTASQVASVIVALKEAIQQGQLSMDQVNQSVQRILLMKMQYGIIK